MNSPIPILYSFRRCPYAMRARMALAVGGIEVEHREVDLKERPDELYAASAKGTVPVVVLPDDSILDESLDVMRWALAQSDPEAWLPRDAAEEEDARSLLARNDCEFKHHLDRYKYATRYEGVDPEEHRAAASLILQDLDARLAESGFLMGQRFTYVDAAVAPFVRQFAFADKTWFDERPWPHLHAWLEAFLASPRFHGIMQKHEPWKPD